LQQGAARNMTGTLGKRPNTDILSRPFALESGEEPDTKPKRQFDCNIQRNEMFLHVCGPGYRPPSLILPWKTLKES
jgi:hypothetical protein